MTNHTPSISVMIPVGVIDNRFHRCLSALAQCSPPPNEIIVAIDGGDGSGIGVGIGVPVKIVKLAERHGPAAARNLGASNATSDIFLFIDSDVVVATNIITRVRTFFAENPDADALIGSYDDQPSETNLLSQYKNLLHHYVHQMANEEASTFWGACGAIRREAFMHVGGFDESYKIPCVEDIALGYQLTKLGYRIVLKKDLQVKHLKRWSAASLFVTDFVYRGIPWTELILRERKMLNDLNTTYIGRLKVVIAFIIVGQLLLFWHHPFLITGAGELLAALIVMDMPLLRFFRRKRGFIFSILTIPWQLLYHFYSGMAFVCGAAKVVCASQRRVSVENISDEPVAP